MMNGLSTTEVEHLRHRLRTEHRELRRELVTELARSGDGRHSDLAGAVHDRGDEAVADLIEDLEIAALDHHVHRVRLIESALESIDAGRYGLCLVCGARIGSARLEADPAVERCIDCQTAAEQGRHAPTL